jgi:hypothetical protein
MEMCALAHICSSRSRADLEQLMEAGGTAMNASDEDFARVTGSRTRLIVAAVVALLAADAISVIATLFWL